MNSDTLRRLLDDFPFYAEHALRIRDKRGQIHPLVLNSAQKLLHEKIEAQRAAHSGRVRALVLKGRQQGISTYIEGRFYHRTSTTPGTRAIIMTHEAKATANLFGMAKLYHGACPAVLRPSVDKDNANTLSFSKLMSSYKVLTAGAKDTGRSETAQLFHGSEAAFWQNAATHLAGIGQAVPEEPGTEIILESTGNGIDNLFHELWQKAEAGLSDFMPVFIPWFLQSEYAVDPRGKFEPDELEAEYGRIYGLDERQLAWRRKKVMTDFSGDVALFNQEYPASPELAFMFTDGEPFLNQMKVAAARKRNAEARGAKVVGIDPAEMGDDRSVFLLRQGLKVQKTEKYIKRELMELVGLAANFIAEHKPDAVFVDAVGVGAGVYARLVELFPNVTIVRVHSGASAFDRELYVNVRAEMWGGVNDWLEEGGQIPDSDEFAADLLAPGLKYDSQRRKQLTSKKDLKVRSPDFGDALALTFYMPVEVREPAISGLQKKLHDMSRRGRRTRSAMAA